MSGQPTEELEPLEADVADLVAAARPLEVASADKKAHAYALVASRIGALGGSPNDGGSGNGDLGGGSTAAGVGAKTVLASKAWMAAIATFALGGALGGGVMYAVVDARPPRVVTVAVPAMDRNESSFVDKPIPPAASSVAVMDLPSTREPERTRNGPSPSANPSPSSNTGATVEGARGLAAERGLLDVARAALTRGAPEEALEAVERHMRDYPQGLLAEEREAIAIKALAAVGRMTEAKARAARFRARYPKSLSLPAIEGVVGATSQ
jgi:hypothetical protein